MPKGIYKHKITQGFRQGNKLGLGKQYMLGKKVSLETREKHKQDWIKEKNPNWKGDQVGYSGVHHWITKMLGQPKYCANCSSTTKSIYHWANISKAYKRELSDWVRLCVKCHSAYDRGKINL